MKIVLYDYWRSSAAYRVRIALNLKGVAYERRPINLLEGAHRAPDNLARHPQGLVPTLEVDRRPLTQSLAIIDWLDGAFTDPRLIPADQPARALALAQTMVIAADTHPIDNLRVLKRLESQFGADQTARDDWYRHWIALGLEALEAMAGDGPFLGGDAPGIADVFLVPQLYNARRFAMDLSAYPKLTRADAAAAEIDAFSKAAPEAMRLK